MNKKMTRIIALVLVGVMLLGLVATGLAAML